MTPATPGRGRLGVGVLGEVVEEVPGEPGSRGAASRGGSPGTVSANRVTWEIIIRYICMPGWGGGFLNLYVY